MHVLVLGAGVIGWFAWDMPNPSTVLAQDNRQPAVTIVASDGSVPYTHLTPQTKTLV